MAPTSLHEVVGRFRYGGYPGTIVEAGDPLPEGLSDEALAHLVARGVVTEPVDVARFEDPPPDDEPEPDTRSFEDAEEAQFFLVSAGLDGDGALDELTREDLDEVARNLGVEDPKSLSNKPAVIAAIKEVSADGR